VREVAPIWIWGSVRTRFHGSCGNSKLAFPGEQVTSKTWGSREGKKITVGMVKAWYSFIYKGVIRGPRTAERIDGMVIYRNIGGFKLRGELKIYLTELSYQN
jgi:hypothetical protein